MARLNSLFTAFLTIAASTQKLGINLIRVAILVIFVWIGGSGTMRPRVLCLSLPTVLL